MDDDLVPPLPSISSMLVRFIRIGDVVVSLSTSQYTRDARPQSS